MYDKVRKFHGHVQIEYCKKGTDYPGIESLNGIDPRDPEARQYVHVALDEYLDVLAQRLTDIESSPDDLKDFVHHDGKSWMQYRWEEAGFRVFPFIDR